MRIKQFLGFEKIYLSKYSKKLEQICHVSFFRYYFTKVTKHTSIIQHTSDCKAISKEVQNCSKIHWYIKAENTFYYKSSLKLENILAAPVTSFASDISYFYIFKGIL